MNAFTSLPPPTHSSYRPTASKIHSASVVQQQGLSQKRLPNACCQPVNTLFIDVGRDCCACWVALILTQCIGPPEDPLPCLLKVPGEPAAPRRLGSKCSHS